MNPNGFQHDFGADEWSYECSACVVYILTLEGETMRKEKQEPIVKHCDSPACVLCNPCSYCEGAGDIYFPADDTVVCIECVKDGELDAK
jgi:hypothetical protein